MNKVDNNSGRRKVGIMGGTFDPIHLGHLILGETAYEQLELEKVCFMPSGNPPHKKNRKGCASDEERSDMVRLAIQGNPHFELSLMEMHEEGYSYTYRTLETLRAQHPDTDYYFIIGADSLYTFHTWMLPQRICQNCTLVVAVRDHVSAEALDEAIQKTSLEFDARIVKLVSPNIDISSTELRSWIQSGKSVRYYVPEKVREYIAERRVYS